MGCIISFFKRSNGQIPLEETTDEPKVYSWDKRDRSNLQDFIIDGQKGQTVVRHPGSVNGEQIIVQNCEDSNIYIFDRTATVSVDDCINCRIFIGPSKSSVFIRDCKQCKFAIICQQFRTRDCFQIDTFLLCGTQPIIESSGRMRFACLQYKYEHLDEHFKAAGLSVFNNNWSSLHDFSPVPEEVNFSLLPPDSRIEDFVPLPEGDEFNLLDIKVDSDSSVIPLTLGDRGKTSNESCLVVFFYDDHSTERAFKFLKNLKSQYPHCQLIHTKEVTMNAGDAERIFGSDAYAKTIQKGAVIGMDLNGDNAVKYCQEVLVSLMDGVAGLVFVSQNPQLAESQIEQFYSFADMQMGI